MQVDVSRVPAGYGSMSLSQLRILNSSTVDRSLLLGALICKSIYLLLLASLMLGALTKLDNVYSRGLHSKRLLSAFRYFLR